MNRSTPGRLFIVVGGQFGSEGKGHLAAQLTKRLVPGSLVIRTGGPNAGHTVWRHKEEYKLRMLPTAVAVRDDVHVALAPKSVVDPAVLYAELKRFPDLVVFVDPRATILEPEHIVLEGGDPQMAAIGSTRKGIGAARKARIGRTARVAEMLWGYDGSEEHRQVFSFDVQQMALASLAGGYDVLVEAAQGYGLGLHTKYYPHTTSGDCTALDALADCMISPWSVGVVPQIWMAIRPYPIRVAGTSGPLVAETTWAALGLPEERTTVTNLVRRVGAWDGDLVRSAVLANGGRRTVKLALMMADQIVPELANTDDPKVITKMLSNVDSDLYQLVESVTDDANAGIGAIGTGPRTMVFAEDFGGLAL